MYSTIFNETHPSHEKILKTVCLFVSGGRTCYPAPAFMLKYENMNSKKLFEILTLVNSVKSSRWNDVRKIVEIMPFIEVKEKKWNEKYKQDNPNWYPL